MGYLNAREHRLTRRNTRQLKISLALIAAGTLFGILGFVIIEGFPVVDAIYMTIITLSTVGFTEVHPLSQSGRVFTSILIVTNFGIFAYSLTQISSFIFEGEIRRYFMHLNTSKRIDQLNNHIILCGLGRNGREVAEELTEHKRDLIIIEQDRDITAQLAEEEKYIFIHGDATHDDILMQAGIDRATALITTLPEDAQNLFVVLSARQLNPNLRIISRAFDDTSERKLVRAGADHVIMPERIGGSYMASLVMNPDIVEFLNEITRYGDVSIGFEEISFSHLDKDLQNKTITDLDIRRKTGANIIGLKTADGEYIVNPSADTVMRQGMSLILLGDQEQIRDLKKYFRIPE